MKIVLVDDQPQYVEAIVERLEFEGHKVFLCTSAKEGVRTAMREEPDLVITDYMMPHQRGDYVRDYLSEARPKMPVFIWSSCPEDCHAEKVLEKTPGNLAKIFEELKSVKPSKGNANGQQ